MRLYILTSLSISLFFGKQYDKAKYYAEKDTLTGAYNRRFLLRIFPKLLAMVDRNNEQLSLLLVDVNDFKKINDTYGHSTGDKVLQSISRVLQTTTRQSDIVVRWGGDEFLIITPYVDKNSSLSLIKRIESKLDTVSDIDLNIDIFITTGVATYPENGKNLDDLIRIADEKMYTFKKERDQI